VRWGLWAFRCGAFSSSSGCASLLLVGVVQLDVGVGGITLYLYRELRFVVAIHDVVFVCVGTTWGSDVQACAARVVRNGNRTHHSEHVPRKKSCAQGFAHTATPKDRHQRHQAPDHHLRCLDTTALPCEQGARCTFWRVLSVGTEKGHRGTRRHRPPCLTQTGQ